MADQKIRWIRRGPRSYEFGTDTTYQAFLFGCQSPANLWAWVAYWTSGKSEECIAQLVEVQRG